MNRNDIIKNFSKETGQSMKVSRDYFNIMFDFIIDGMIKEHVMIDNFGRFEIRTRKGGNRHNPKTGERVTVPDRNTIVFKPSGSLKKRLNKRGYYE